ncbi:proline racemase family protein [Paraburkholderia sp. Ac-20340]|uniref:proline racemase family protein n=1 Tax=Paraburkholderia sp. Ac-20340 TaxID=2703888 RepID=UPI001981AF60|nr:proline racemase family protein [Paraburkholderia sp. Ac-20340]MBN3853995.1 proline racemase family protein [Paraburkholderia sp. Ac-20340]
MRWKNVYQVVDCHAEGEVGKVLTGGVFDVPGETMFDKRNFLMKHRDDIRRLCLLEPRGSVTDTLSIVLPATHPDAQLGFVSATVTEYPVMSGSNVIALATVLLETGILPMNEPRTDFVLEAPAGLIRVSCQCNGGKVQSVRFTNQPSFVYYTDEELDVEGLGRISVDVAYGGETFVMVDAGALGLALEASEARELCAVGEAIKSAANSRLKVQHPMNSQVTGIGQVQFMGPVARDGSIVTSRNAVVLSPGRLDRSPCGTGTAARLALMYARKEIAEGETFIHESLIGARLESRIERVVMEGPQIAVEASVEGRAWITGLHQVGMDPSDPFGTGFVLPDTHAWFPGDEGRHFF